MSQRHPFQNDIPMLVTTNTIARWPYFKNSANAREAVECLYRVQEQHPFFLFAFVIMPDHCHFLMNVPAPQKISNILSAYKSGLTFDTGIHQLWQKRFHIRIPSGEGSMQRMLKYIHMNPVKKGLAESPEAYPWSSASGMYEITPIG